jgi:hypothetical protein
MNRFTRRTTALIVSTLVLVAMIGATAAPATADRGRGPGYGRPPGNGAAACSGVPATQACFGVDEPIENFIAKQLGSFVLSQGAGFIFKRIGLADWLSPDPIQGKLDALQAQISQVSTQLVTVQASLDQISRDLQQIQLNQAYNSIKAPIFNTQWVYNYAFKPVFVAAVEAQNATVSTREAKLAVLADKKAQFLAAFNQYQLGSASTQIHDSLKPGGVSTSVVDAYGRVLMATNRFVTAKQSATFKALRTVFAEHEALAVWMKAEYVAAVDPGSLPDLIADEFTGWQAAAALATPPEIPADAVVDLGATTATRVGTSKRLMWVPQRQGGAGNVPSFSWRVGDSTSANGVAQALGRLNTAAPGGFIDWRTPTRAEVTDLFSGFVRGHAPRLDTFNPDWQGYNQFQSFLWVSDQVPQQVECGRHTTIGEFPVTDIFTRTYQTHTGLWLNNAQPTNYNELVWAPFPKLDARAPGWSSNTLPAPALQACDTYAETALGGGRGALVATRSTGDAEYFALRVPPGVPSGGGNGGPRGQGHWHDYRQGRGHDDHGHGLRPKGAGSR